MTTTPDFRAELEKLVDLYKALGGNWCPHGYTDIWNDALASARTALATPPPTDDDLIEIARELRKTAEYLQLGCGWNKALRAIESAANLIEGDLLQRLVPPPEPPAAGEVSELMRCLANSLSSFKITQCDYIYPADHWSRRAAELLERTATPPPEPPTDEELYEYWISTSPQFGCADPVGFARAALERWGYG